MRSKKTLAVAAVALSGALLAAGCSSGSNSSGGGGSKSVNWANCVTVASCGGMKALITAAKKEGQLNVITLPSNWANYGTIMKDFTAKYGIHITDANPEGSSQDELNAVTSLKGQSRAPDVLDMGTPFAIKGDQEGLLAPYKVATWANIPASAKASDATWYGDYGGYVAIGYNPAKVKVAPTSFKDLLKPIYKNQIAINNNPTEAGAAFAAVYAAALANGGSFSNIQPGIDYFAKLRKEGNFEPVVGGPTTVQNGSTPILVWWDYLLASEVKTVIPGFKIVIPSDAAFASYYDQAINKDAPNPAAARLWEEFLYSTEGQNLWLEGYARPIELPTLVANGTVNKAAYDALPPAPSGTLTFPSQAEYNKAEDLVSQDWAKEVLG
ncbi:MAG TPA: ABC transporter substrate-binding protein [Streptosporangiaceae bacterium]|nr:ABC transporter substrate-binding protein [Streptosporangiaceae bacterium]